MFDGENNTETGAYNRKEKSLGELCRRFLFLYGTPSKGRLYLDQCTRELGVERRRIYDIINILESFSVIERDIKNEYVWRGIDKIIVSIDQQIAVCVSTIAHDCGNITRLNLIMIYIELILATLVFDQAFDPFKFKSLILSLFRSRNLAN